MKTDWGGVADWYENHLDQEDTYHAKVIAPNLIRLLGDINNKNILDIACGNGFFSSILIKWGG